MPRKFATDEEREAAQKEYQERYRSKPGIRERYRDRAREYQRKKKAAKDLAREMAKKYPSIPLSSQSGGSSTPPIATNGHPPLNPQALVKELQPKYKPLQVSTGGELWEAFEETVESEEDHVLYLFEPSPESINMVREQCHALSNCFNACPNEKAVPMPVERYIGRLARLQAGLSQERTRAVEAAQTPSMVAALRLHWSDQLVRAESRRQRFLRLNLDDDRGCPYIILAKVLREWSEREVLYLSESLCLLQLGREEYLKHMKTTLTSLSL